METQNLWPDIIAEETKSPATILREQAAYLAEKTNNVLTAEVRQLRESVDREISYAFYIVAPALQNYRYQLLGISYKMPYYPVTISWGGDDDGADQEITAHTEQSFISWLEDIFKNPYTVRIISSLYAESRSNGNSSAVAGDLLA